MKLEKYKEFLDTMTVDELKAEVLRYRSGRDWWIEKYFKDTTMQ